MQRKTIVLPVCDIVVELYPSSQYADKYLAGNIAATGVDDSILSLILAHAVAGVDVQSPAYLEGLETALENIANNT